MELLNKAIEVEGRMAGVANKLGVSRTLISLVVNGKYENVENTDLFRRLRTHYGYLEVESNSLMCPILGIIKKEVCLKYYKAVIEKRDVGGSLFLSVKAICARCLIGANNAKDCKKD